MNTEKINLNVAVFTTKYVVKDGSPIVYVSHDSEGDWQFLGAETDVQMENSMLVSLGEIIEMDTSIKELLGIPRFAEAHRKNKNSKWEVIYKQ
jgi:hypothetical protein